MLVRLLTLLICFSPNILLAKQEQSEIDLELFEFLAMYEKDDVVFIDSEIEGKNEMQKLTNQKVKMSESDDE